MEVPLRVVIVCNDLNGAQRLNDLNVLNRLRSYVSEAVERFERLELLRTYVSVVIQRLEPLERTDPTTLLEHTHKRGIASSVAPVMMHDAATLMHIKSL